MGPSDMLLASEKALKKVPSKMAGTSHDKEDMLRIGREQELNVSRDDLKSSTKST